jgi:hypothetical protein
VRCIPARIHQVGAGDSLTGIPPLVHSSLHLPVLLARPEPSGGAGPSCRCQGCSRRLLGLQQAAALSFAVLLRQARRWSPFTSTRSSRASWRTFRRNQARLSADVLALDRHGAPVRPQTRTPFLPSMSHETGCPGRRCWTTCFGARAPVIDLSRGGVADLHDRHLVQGVVELAVPTPDSRSRITWPLEAVIGAVPVSGDLVATRTEGTRSRSGALKLHAMSP